MTEKPRFPFPIKILTSNKEVRIVRNESELPESEFKILDTNITNCKNLVLRLNNK